MNVRAEVEALGVVVVSLPEWAVRGAFTVDEIQKIARYLQGRVPLVKRLLATDEIAEFQKILEASGYES